MSVLPWQIVKQGFPPPSKMETSFPVCSPFWFLSRTVPKFHFSESSLLHNQNKWKWDETHHIRHHFNSYLYEHPGELSQEEVMDENAKNCTRYCRDLTADIDRDNKYNLKEKWMSHWKSIPNTQYSKLNTWTAQYTAETWLVIQADTTKTIYKEIDIQLEIGLSILITQYSLLSTHHSLFFNQQPILGTWTLLIPGC